MQVYIGEKLVEARVIERGALRTGGGWECRPILVEYAGRRVWVYDDEGDGRVTPGDAGPCRVGTYGLYVTKQCGGRDR